MLAILNSLNANNLTIFQPILMILVSKFMIHRALSEKTHVLIRLLSPLITYKIHRIYKNAKLQCKCVTHFDYLISNLFSYLLSSL